MSFSGKMFIEVWMIITVAYFFIVPKSLIAQNHFKTTGDEVKIDSLFEQWDSGETPGASIAIVKNGMLLFSKGYGMANMEYGIPNSSKTIFNIASVSKQFTAFSVAILADQNKLGLDDDIRKYLPELPDLGKIITIRNLIHHTSGLKDFFELMLMSGWLLEDLMAQEHIMGSILNQRTLNFNPGDEFLYSNTGYVLLARIVEKVTGSSFSEWTRKNIFEPLDMKDTFYSADYDEIVKNMAYSYKKTGKGFRKEIHNSSISGAGGIYTNVEDLIKWIINFDSISVGNPMLMDMVHQRGILNNGKTTDYAFGQEVTTHKGLPLAVHGGGIAGYRTYLCRFPKQHLSIVVLCNSALFSPREKAMQIADIYLSDFFSQETSRSKGETRKIEATQKIPTETLKEYVGRYQISDDMVFRVWLEGDLLKGHFTGKKQTHTFEPISRERFGITALSSTIEFEMDDNNRVNAMTIFHKGAGLNAIKLDSFDPKTVNLMGYVGKYHSEELHTIYNVKVVQGKLTAKPVRGTEITLELGEPDYFTGTLVPRIDINVKMVRDTDWSISGFNMSSRRARQVWFKKID